MVVLAVAWMAKAGNDADVVPIFAKLTEESRKEPGCLMYQVHRHKTEPRRFFIYEQYKDDAALEAHRGAPHFLQYARKDLPNAEQRLIEVEPGVSVLCHCHWQKDRKALTLIVVHGL